jgi:DNA (cytosine-5)-methyltransferase 1
MKKSSTKNSKSKAKADKENLKNGTVDRKLGIVSLFSGAGGLEIAACNTGRVGAIVSTDSNETFLSTVESNMPIHYPEVRHSGIVADAKALTGKELRQALGSKPDIVMGGPPCDDYTRFGRRLGYEGEKGPLIFEFLRIVNEIKPSCFIFENVPNLAQQFKNVFEEFLAQTESIGYFSNWSLIKACYFGAPTLRKRVFVVGFKKHSLGRIYQFPEQTHADPAECELLVQPNGPLKPYKYVSDVLDGLPEVKTQAAEKFLNHVGRNHRPETIEGLKDVPQGKNIKKSFRYRAPWQGLTQSLTAGLDNSTKSYIHPYFHREMSVREYARLHEFPDSWFFSGTHHNGIKQVANSVPISLGEAVFASAIKHLLTS